MATVGLRSCFLFLFATHLVWSRKSCNNQQNSIQCPSESKFLCLLLRRNLQQCDGISKCACGAKCCSLGCGSYCWPLGGSHLEPVAEISSNNLAQRRKKRSSLSLQPLNSAAVSYLQNPSLSGYGGYGPIPGQPPNGYGPSGYPLNLPNRFAPYPNQLFYQTPRPYVPPAVAEFLIVGTNKTLRLMRPNVEPTDGSQNAKNPFIGTPAPSVNAGGPQPRSGSSDGPPVGTDFKPTTAPQTDQKMKFDKPGSSSDSQAKHLFPSVDDKSRMNKKIDVLKKALKELGVNKKVAERVRHQKIIEKFLKPRPVKVKLNFHLRVKNESDPHLGHDFPPPVVVDGNAYDFMGRKGARIPYTWSIEYRPRSTSGSEGVVHPGMLNISGQILPRSAVSDTKPNQKGQIEDEFDVYIWYLKDQNAKAPEPQQKLHETHESEPVIGHNFDGGQSPGQKHPVEIPDAPHQSHFEQKDKLLTDIHKLSDALGDKFNQDHLENKQKDLVSEHKDKLFEKDFHQASPAELLPKTRFEKHEELERSHDKAKSKEVSELQIPHTRKPLTDDAPVLSKKVADVDLHGPKMFDSLPDEKPDLQISKPPADDHERLQSRSNGGGHQMDIPLRSDVQSKIAEPAPPLTGKGDSEATNNGNRSIRQTEM